MMLIKETGLFPTSRQMTFEMYEGTITAVSEFSLVWRRAVNEAFDEWRRCFLDCVYANLQIDTILNTCCTYGCNMSSFSIFTLNG